MTLLSLFSSHSKVRHDAGRLYLYPPSNSATAGWKRLLLSDGPRQTINAMTLYSFWLVNQGNLNIIEGYWTRQPLVTKFLLISILFTVLVFLGSLLILIVAALCYVPLLCYIQGNLKEYCCHKVDKVRLALILG